MTITDFTTATPREIDTELAEIYGRIYKAQDKAREAERLEKALCPSGEPLVLNDGKHYDDKITTLSAARGWLTDAAWYGTIYGSHPSYPEHNRLIVAQAVAAKEGKAVEAVLAEAAKRAAKRK